MKYITGLHALNLNCQLETCGDWHQSGIQWQRPAIKESTGSLFGSYGIEAGHSIPEHSETFYAANHIRAVLDLLMDGNFSLLQGMKEELICNDAYTLEIFEKAWCLRSLSNWKQIDAFLQNEYMLEWIAFKWMHGIKTRPAARVKDGFRSAPATVISHEDIDEIAFWSVSRYVREQVRLIDIFYICLLLQEYREACSSGSLWALTDTVGRTGIERFEYVKYIDPDPGIDIRQLNGTFYQLWDELYG